MIQFSSSDLRKSDGTKWPPVELAGPFHLSPTAAPGTVAASGHFIECAVPSEYLVKWRGQASATLNRLYCNLNKNVTFYALLTFRHNKNTTQKKYIHFSPLQLWWPVTFVPLVSHWVRALCSVLSELVKLRSCMVIAALIWAMLHFVSAMPFEIRD